MQAGILSLNSLPKNLESMRLPTFEAGSGSSAAQIAATVAATQASYETSILIPKGNLPQPHAPHSGSLLTTHPATTKVGGENLKLKAC